MPAHLLYGDSFLVSQALRDLETESGAANLLDGLVVASREGGEDL